MNAASATFAQASVPEDFALFKTLSAEQRLKAFSAMTRQDLVRGQLLVEQGAPSDALFLVLHGALAVYRKGQLEPIAELRAGEVVGEIGFFADIPRTADVIAIRDASVLALTRTAYEALAREAPAIVEALLAALGAAIRPRDRPPHAASCIAQGPDGGADIGRLRAAAAGFRAEIASCARRRRCRDRRSRAARGCAARPRAGRIRSHGMAQQARARRAADRLFRRPRSLEMGAESHSPGRHGGVPVPRRCASARSVDGTGNLRLRGASGLRAAPRSHS